MDNLANVFDCELNFKETLIDEPISPLVKKKYKIENKWEGVILEIDEDNVISRLYDCSSGEFDEFIFSKNRISDDDKDFLEEGALFNFYIGYLYENGTQINKDIIKFRRRLKERNEIDSILDSLNEIDFDNLIEDY